MGLPEVEGVLTADEVAATADTIARLQLPCGMIPWFPDGHCDPWNHVETAMALSVTGHLAEAERAYEWLMQMQRPDGSWFNYYVADADAIVVEDAKLDTNVCAYVATGVWHHWLVTRDLGFVEALWPTVRRALDWVLGMQTERGEIVWAREVHELPWQYALLTGSSSIWHALGCGLRLADLIGMERPRWQLAHTVLGRVIRTMPHAFEPKDRWAMDWYYPVLCGVLGDDAAERRLASLWDTFVMPSLGVRCVSEEPWVTAAETAECAIAHAAVGYLSTGTKLLAWTRAHRHEDGSYWTGLVYPDRVHFPGGERTAYTAAAVIIAADAIGATSAASGIFVADGALVAGD
jgi:MMP endo-(1,4)-3-O-methyl-alpha-D-mannosidase